MPTGSSTSTEANVFDQLAEVFEELVDWPKRLANEEPFYRLLFAQHAVHRVADVACGTGRHAAMFHDWGPEVEGSDLSPQMIDIARRRHGQPPGLRWVVRGFDQPITPAGAFDAAICVGNSLALAGDRATAQQALREMLAVVRAGGAVVVHVVNLWRLPDGPCVWFKSKRTRLGEGGEEVFLARGMHRAGPRAWVELLVADLAGKSPLQSKAAELVAFEADDLEAMARAAGAADVQFFGDYHNQPYDRQRSVDLIMVAAK